MELADSSAAGFGRNILYVGLATISQKQLDLTLGYSSVMHMGYVFPWMQL